jgi:hypothetical protein
MDILFDLVTLPFELISGGQECFCTCFGVLAVGACCVAGVFIFVLGGGI